MSGLEKFQCDEAWRKEFKRFLLTERQITQNNDPLKQTQRFSLEFVEGILKEKRPLPNLTEINEMENKDRIKPSHDSGGQNLSDSFEAIERMCNKTASDPNSTLFHFINSEKDKIALNVNNRNTEEMHLKCNERGFLNEIKNEMLELKKIWRKEDENIENHIKQKELHVTQIEDIEAPSKLWDNSLEIDVIQQTSPVKLAGLLRPSTILEEENYEKSLSLETSYKNVSKQLTSSASSIYYESANNLLKSNYGDKTITSKQLKESEPDLMSSKFEVISYDGSKNLENLRPTRGQSENHKTYRTTFKKSLSPEENTENSIRLNDTLEEVEYMLKKGIEYMSAHDTINLKLNDSPSNNIDYNTESEEIKKKSCSTEFVKKDGDQSNNFTLNIKPFSKFELFKKPKTSSIPCKNYWTQTKRFVHIVSPVKAYMRKTGKTPLMTSIKSKNTYFNMKSSTVFKDLACDSHYKQKILQSKTRDRIIDLSDLWSISIHLPKKIYISSKYKQIFDERTPIKIPGGKKIQRYLEPAIIPAVVCHKGKLKASKSSNIPIPTNCGSMNLSTTSGDISIYTIKDAQKF